MFVAMISGDFDGDGRIDLAIGNGAQITLLKGGGDGTFVLGGSFPVAGDGRFAVPAFYNDTAAYSFARQLIVADLDADGDFDIAGSDGSGVLTAFLPNLEQHKRVLAG